VFSAGCGLLEVLLSPILNAVPSSRKAGDMALLHAFYPLGKLAVIIGTALALWRFGTASWPWVVGLWALLPLGGVIAFARVALPELPAGAERVRVRDLARTARFRWVLLAMALAGATELGLAQWTSAFAQRGLGWSQLVADLVGFACFALGMAIGRLWYGVAGSGERLPQWLLRAALASLAIHLIAALSPWPLLALIACASGGCAVSLLWPWTVSHAAALWPLAGASLFALLAAAGDAGAALNPWLISIAADAAAATPAWWWSLIPVDTPEATSLRVGLLVGALSPLLLAIVAWRLRRAEP